MYSLVLMLSWLPQAVSASGPPAPENLRLKSVNFNHVLHWERGAGTSLDVAYSVSFCKHGDPCTVVEGCERVLEPLVCNLTEALWDPDETYDLRVTALQLSQRSYNSWKNFHPARDTELEPPILRVALCNTTHLCVEMEAPVPHLRSTYESFWYELKVKSNTSQQVIPATRSLRKKEIPGVIVGSEYCVSVRFKDDIVPRESEFSPAQCVFVHGPDHTTTVLLMVLLPVLLLLLVAVCYTIFYYTKKTTLPSVLTSVLHSEEKGEVFCHPAVSSLLLIESAPSEGQTECCSSETDCSEDEQDSVEATEVPDVELYMAKASMCSVEVQEEGPEEVDLLTLIFSRDKDTEKSALLLSEVEPPACTLVEEQSEPEEDSSEECVLSGYMSR